MTKDKLIEKMLNTKVENNSTIDLQETLKNKKPDTLKSVFAENPDIKYLVIEIEETSYWNDRIKEKIDKAFCVYLCINKPTNLCSYDVAYLCIPLYNSFDRKEGYEDDEELDDCEFHIEDEVSYYNDTFILENFHIVNDDFETDEDAEEYYRRNCIL
jgi:hypothetical protein